jgi:hypothetical protein
MVINSSISSFKVESILVICIQGILRSAFPGEQKKIDELLHSLEVYLGNEIPVGLTYNSKCFGSSNN